jgi:hypothetical protein
MIARRDISPTICTENKEDLHNVLKFNYGRPEIVVYACYLRYSRGHR